MVDYVHSVCLISHAIERWPIILQDRLKNGLSSNSIHTPNFLLRSKFNQFHWPKINSRKTARPRVGLMRETIQPVICVWILNPKNIANLKFPRILLKFEMIWQIVSDNTTWNFVFGMLQVVVKLFWHLKWFRYLRLIIWISKISIELLQIQISVYTQCDLSV